MDLGAKCCLMLKKILPCIQVLLKCKILGVNSVCLSLLHSDIKQPESLRTEKVDFPYKLQPLLLCLPPWYVCGRWRLSSKQLQGFICGKLLFNQGSSA